MSVVWTTTAGQTTGARLVDILSRTEVDDAWAASTSIDTGLSTLQSNDIEFGANVLNECQSVNKAEQGRFFVSRSNVLTFQDRASVAAGTPVVNFTDAAAYANGQTAGKIPFSVVEVTFGSELFYTKVSVEIIGGTPQTADDLIAQANPPGIRTLPLSQMLLDSEGQADDLAEYLVDRYSTPEAVVSAIRVPLHKLSSANRTAVAGLEISDTVSLDWTPTAGLGAISETLVIEGIGYQIENSSKPATWMTFQLSAAPTNDFFILDTDLLDTDAVGF